MQLDSRLRIRENTTVLHNLVKDAGKLRIGADATLTGMLFPIFIFNNCPCFNAYDVILAKIEREQNNEGHPD